MYLYSSLRDTQCLSTAVGYLLGAWEVCLETERAAQAVISHKIEAWQQRQKWVDLMHRMQGI